MASRQHRSMPRLNRKRSLSAMRQFSDACDASMQEARPLSAAPNCNTIIHSGPAPSPIGQISKQDSIKDMVRSFFRRRPTNESRESDYKYRSNPNTRWDSGDDSRIIYTNSPGVIESHDSRPIRTSSSTGELGPIHHHIRHSRISHHPTSRMRSTGNVFRLDVSPDSLLPQPDGASVSESYTDVHGPSTSTGLTPRPSSAQQSKVIYPLIVGSTQGETIDGSSFYYRNPQEVVREASTDRPFDNSSGVGEPGKMTSQVNDPRSQSASFVGIDSAPVGSEAEPNQFEYRQDSTDNHKDIDYVVLEGRFKDLEKRMRTLERTVLRIYRQVRGPYMAGAKSVDAVSQTFGDPLTNLTNSTSEHSISPETVGLVDLPLSGVSHYRMGTFGGSSPSLSSKSGSSPAAILSVPGSRFPDISSAQLGRKPLIPGSDTPLVYGQTPNQHQLHDGCQQYEALAALVEKERVARKGMKVHIMSLQREVQELKSKRHDDIPVFKGSNRSRSGSPALQQSKFSVSEDDFQMRDDNGFYDAHDHSVYSNDDLCSNEQFQTPLEVNYPANFLDVQTIAAMDDGQTSKSSTLPLTSSRLAHPEGFI
ncbi:hypothetical protein L228DRAFT_267543 [Xylona heveae TC161]|uniref:Uncharacterized protein n=1 Tax=Xylona heveae (strain CBS 132557 / TC161) TaxID=1328760 RepID=A0A165HI35_XYLHT|nr:hypothetical protein L228DRAFT_267543 [Xylona heveae TC161]KZF23553.1 hypothetical protein L228DRAFT_267543 [Xylona heveae TC161]